MGSKGASAVLAEAGPQLIERFSQRPSVAIGSHIREDCAKEFNVLRHGRELAGLDAAVVGIVVSRVNYLELLGESAADQ